MRNLVHSFLSQSPHFISRLAGSPANSATKEAVSAGLQQPTATCQSADFDKPVCSGQKNAPPPPTTTEPSRWSMHYRGNTRSNTGSLSLARLCSDFLTLSEEDLTEKDDIFNTCDELNDFLLNDLTDDSDMTREH